MKHISFWDRWKIDLPLEIIENIPKSQELFHHHKEILTPGTNQYENHFETEVFWSHSFLIDKSSNMVQETTPNAEVSVMIYDAYLIN